MSKPCCVCGLPGATYYDWGRKWQHGTVMTCVDQLSAALAHERDRAKRVVRVFWRVRYPDRFVSATFNHRGAAFLWARHGGKVYRVTVRRAPKTAPTPAHRR